MVDDDPDRAAILARRQRFITLALSGLTLGCGDDGGSTSSPMPCLDIGPQTESMSDGTTDSMSGPVETTAESTAQSSDGTSTTGMPMPCLDVAPDSSSGTTDGTSTTSATDGESSSSGGPMPCLAPKG
ncbi:MAG TPA: hypothetical protein VG755_29995 [Nannocystaceae bacterium]|nr:hypothetical protein [Nannocystaceae bacterium]